jgi:cytochrome P450
MTLQIDTRELDPSKIHQVNAWSIKQDPVPHFLDWLERGPFYTVMDGDVPSAVFARYKDVEAIYRDHRRFSSVKPHVKGLDKLDYFNGQPNLAYVDPPQHTRLRKVVQPAFSPRLVEALADGIGAKLAQLFSAAEATGPSVEFMGQIAHPLSAHTLLGLFLGVPEEGNAIFDRLNRGIYMLYTMQPGAPKPDEYMRAWQEAADYSNRLADERRRHPREDVVSSLVAAAEVGERITGEELLGMLLTLYVGGLSSVAAVVGNGLVLVGRHDDQRALLARSPELADPAFDEIMRMDSPGTVNFRFATKDTEVSGLRIWKDMPVYISQQAAGYDPAMYQDPLRFDITRRPKILQFGAGVHLCIGAPIARLVWRRLITEMNARWPAWQLDGPDQELRYDEGFPGERLPNEVRIRIAA